MVKSNGIVTVGSSRFRLVETIADFGAPEVECDFILGKNSRGIEAYLRCFAGSETKNVFELRVWRGGSTAFFYEMLKPKQFVAVDIQPTIAKLENWIEDRALQNDIRTYYGVDQSDVDRILQSYTEVFANEFLDVVLDDASHLLSETRTSFNTLFPRLKAGGVYIIEDWAWGECFRGMEGLLGPPLRGSEPMSALIYEIVAASGRLSEVVDEVVVSDAFVLVRRGAGVLGSDFDISAYC